MAVFGSAESSHTTSENRRHGSFYEANERDHSASEWYFTRREIEENSPSRRDGIDLKKETYLRKSYCTFLQDLGMRLKVPQVTIATAIIFCHRFFLRQSHSKNDRRTIATVCMFLAGKVEETPHSLNNVILVSYEIIHKKDPAARQRIKQKEVYEQQKELILLGERVVLTSLGFDLNVHHPYRPLVEAIKKFRVAQNTLAQVAWNFVNDGLRTSLCLQYKPHHIAAGAIFLAAKFLKVKLPSDGDKVWWQEFDVTPRQLEDVSNQMLELYEQNHTVQASYGGSEIEGGSTSNVTAARPPTKAPSLAANEESTSVCSQPLAMVTGAEAKQSYSDAAHQHVGIPEQSTGTEGSKPGGDTAPHSSHFLRREAASEAAEAEIKNRSGGLPEAIKRIDKDKVKAALEKRKQSRSSALQGGAETGVDDDDLIERELESGVELAAKNEQSQQQQLHGEANRRRSWPGSLPKGDHPQHHHPVVEGDDHHPPARLEVSTAGEEGELSSADRQEALSRSKLSSVPNGKRQLSETGGGGSGSGGLSTQRAEREGKRMRLEAHQ